MTKGDDYMRVLQQTVDRQRDWLLLCGWHTVFRSQCQDEGIVTGAESEMGHSDGRVP